MMRLAGVLMKNAVSLLACWVAVLASVPAGQQLPSPPPTTFWIGVAAVQNDASVLDKQRRPVRGLTADFTVLDHGKPREIGAFSAIERSISEAPAQQERANRASLIERQRSLLTIADWNTLSPGLYVLRMEASGAGVLRRRDVRFTVK